MQSKSTLLHPLASRPENYVTPGNSLARPNSVTIGTIAPKPRATLLNNKPAKVGFNFENAKGGNWPKRNFKETQSALMNPSTPKSVGQFTFESPANFFRTYKESINSHQAVTERGVYPSKDHQMSKDAQSGCILKVDMDQRNQLMAQQPQANVIKKNVEELNRLRYSSNHEIKIVDSQKNDGHQQTLVTLQKKSPLQVRDPDHSEVSDQLDHHAGDPKNPNNQQKTLKVSKRIQGSKYGYDQWINEPANDEMKRDGMIDFLKSNLGHQTSDNFKRDSHWYQRESQEETRSKVDTKPGDGGQTPQDILNVTTQRESSKPRKEALNNFFNKIQGIQDKLINLEKRFDTYGENYKQSNARDQSPNTDMGMKGQLSRRGTEEMSQNMECCFIDIKKKTLNSSRHLKSKASLKQEGKDTETSFRISDKLGFEKMNESLVHNTRYLTADKLSERKQENLLSIDALAKFNPPSNEKAITSHQSNSLSPSMDKHMGNSQFASKKQMPVFQTFTQVKNDDENNFLKVPMTDGKQKEISLADAEIDAEPCEPIRYYSQKMTGETTVPGTQKITKGDDKVISQILFENLIENYPNTFADPCQIGMKPNPKPCEKQPVSFLKQESLTNEMLERRFDFDDIGMLNSNFKNESTLCEPTVKSKSVRIQKHIQNSPELKGKATPKELDYHQANPNGMRLNFGVNLSSSKDSNTDKSPLSGLLSASFEVAISNLHIRYNNETIRLQQFKQLIDRLKYSYHEKLEKATNFKNDILKTQKLIPSFNDTMYGALHSTYEYLKKEVNLQHLLVMENMQIFRQKSELIEQIGQALNVISYIHNPNSMIPSIIEMFEYVDQLQPVHHLLNNDDAQKDIKFSCVSNLEAYDSRVNHSNLQFSKPPATTHKESSSSKMVMGMSPVRQQPQVELKKDNSPREPISQMILQIQQKYNLKPNQGMFHKEMGNSNVKENPDTSGLQNRRRERSLRGKNQSSYIENNDQSQVETTFFKNIRQQLDSLASNMKTGKTNRFK